jgi:hypothetical protein
MANHLTSGSTLRFPAPHCALSLIDRSSVAVQLFPCEHVYFAYFAVVAQQRIIIYIMNKYEICPGDRLISINVRLGLRLAYCFTNHNIQY